MLSSFLPAGSAPSVDRGSLETFDDSLSRGSCTSRWWRRRVEVGRLRDLFEIETLCPDPLPMLIRGRLQIIPIARMTATAGQVSTKATAKSLRGQCATRPSLPLLTDDRGFEKRRSKFPRPQRYKRHKVLSSHVFLYLNIHERRSNLLLVYITFRTSTSAAVLSLQQSRDGLQLNIASPLVNGTNL
ncbi:hypothetical protein KC361_g44 [Hortaea werneckii]|nr:hypothetical protein KC361_g44 [Hortaea werneckii]